MICHVADTEFPARYFASDKMFQSFCMVAVFGLNSFTFSDKQLTGKQKSLLFFAENCKSTMLKQFKERCTWSGGGHNARLGIEYGHAQAGGTRPHPIEDYHVETIRPFGDGGRIGLFAIFDGHGGSEVAEYLQQIFFDVVLDHPAFCTDPKQAIRESYMAIDQRFYCLNLVLLNDFVRIIAFILFAKVQTM